MNLRTILSSAIGVIVLFDRDRRSMGLLATADVIRRSPAARLRKTSAMQWSRR